MHPRKNNSRFLERISDDDPRIIRSFLPANMQEATAEETKQALGIEPNPYKEQIESAMSLAKAKLRLFEDDKIVSMLESEGLVNFDDVRKIKGIQSQSQDPVIADQLAALKIPEIVFTKKEKLDEKFDL